MAGLLTIIGIGFLLGMRHATDPDHVIAVSTIVTSEHNVRRSAWIGAAWGVGHTLTILAVGGAVILFRLTLSPRVGLSMELAVAVMLIILGIRNVGGGLTRVAHTVPHVKHAHPHFHDDDEMIESHPALAGLDTWMKRFTAYRLMRPLIIGIVHGLAGSAAIALLVLSTITNPRWALAYLGVFGIGTILGMMFITLALGSTLAFGQRRFARIGRHFGLAAGLISLAFGAFIAYDVGIVNGLFTGHLTWIPR